MFNEVASTISLSELQRDKARFASGDHLRKDILKQVTMVTKRDTFPYRGRIKKIGSCWDGSKIGHLDEIDTLFILDETEIKIRQNGDGFSFQVGFATQNECYTASQFVEHFANSINEVLLNYELPSTLAHGGYAAPEYSGVRMNGPAVTLLFSVTQDAGGMKTGDMVTVDITLAVPFSCLRYDSDLGDLCHYLASWVEERVAYVDYKPIGDLDGPYLVLNHRNDGWQPSTAAAESDILHELDNEAPLKQTYRMTKSLVHMVKQHEAFKSLFCGVVHMEDEKNTLGRHLDLYRNNVDQLNGYRQQLNSCMAYGHILIPWNMKKDYHEQEKQPIAVNTTALKHVMFGLAKENDYKPQVLKAERVFQLMKEALKKFLLCSGERPLFVKHSVTNFPEIAKFSLLADTVDEAAEMIGDVQQLYETLLTKVFTEVSSV